MLYHKIPPPFGLDLGLRKEFCPRLLIGFCQILELPDFHKQAFYTHIFS